MTARFPLLSGRPLSSFEYWEFQAYVIGLRGKYMKYYREKRERAKLRSQKPKAKDYSYRINAKGTTVITIRNRKPKFLTCCEINELCQEHKLKFKELEEIIIAKGTIEVKYAQECKH